MAEQSLNELKAQHPMPWGYSVLPGTGTIILLDAAGKEVPMIKMLDFIVFITGKVA